MADPVPTSLPPAATPALPRPDTSGGKDRFVRHANIMSALTVVSRIFGLLRDKACAVYLGNKTTEWSAFWMGFQLPNLFRRIFGEGALTAIFVPIYTRVLHTQGPDAARQLAVRTATLLIGFLSALTLLGECIMIPIALMSDVTPPNRLAAAMIAIMLPYCVFVCLVAFLSAIATVHEKFIAQSISPIILNLFMTAGAVVPVWFLTARLPLAQRIYWTAVTVILAGIVQALQMFWTLRRTGLGASPIALSRQAYRADSGLRELVQAMLPMMLGLSAVQLNAYLDTQIAWWLSPEGHDHHATFDLLGWTIHTPMESGAVGILSVAQRLYLLPVGIFGVSMATAIFPQMAKAVTAQDMPELRRLLIVGLRKTLFISLPASIGMMLVARPLISVIYTADGIDRSTWTAIWFCAGIWAFEAQMVILRAFYALSDRLTPMKVAVAMVLLNFGLNLTLVWFLQEGGIALSTTLSAIVQSVVLLAILRRRLGRLGLSGLISSILRELLACAVMTAVALAVLAALRRWPMPAAHSAQVLRTVFIDLPAVIGASVLVYGGVALLFNMPELKDLPLVGRFFRRRAVLS